MPPENRSLIIQSDNRILLETANPRYHYLREKLLAFSEMESAPEYMHVFAVNRFSLWNAFSRKITAEEIISFLAAESVSGTAGQTGMLIRDAWQRFFSGQISKTGGGFLINLSGFARKSELPACLLSAGALKDEEKFFLPESCAAEIKLQIFKKGFFINFENFAECGADFDIKIRNFTPYYYQQEAAQKFRQYKNGIVMLPCGAGKTAAALLCMAELKKRALIFTAGRISGEQWIREITGKTGIEIDSIGRADENTGCPVTIVTYRLLAQKPALIPALLENLPGIIIFDDVQKPGENLLEFLKQTAHIPKLALSAALFFSEAEISVLMSLIGPVIYQQYWKKLEEEGFLSKAVCREIIIAVSDETKKKLAGKPDTQKRKILACMPDKLRIAAEIISKHPQEKILILASFLEQCREAAKLFSCPLLSGSSSPEKRRRTLEEFRNGKIRICVFSDIGNTALDLPEASLLIQLSGRFGSPLEEAQRIGRILRKKHDSRCAFFYTLVAGENPERNYSMQRRLFMISQGYEYEISAL